MNKFIIHAASFVLLSVTSSYSQGILINEICSSNYLGLEDEDDERGDWVEFYNSGNSSIDMGGMYLTDDFSNRTKYRIPTSDPSKTTIASHDQLIFWLDDESYKGPNHASFKLNNSGEQVALVASNGTSILDSISFDELLYDVTFGRTTDGGSSWSYFPVPTPEHHNTGGGYSGIAGKADFSMDAGFYASGIQVQLTYAHPPATIYYTLDGSDPSSSNGIHYTSSIHVNSTSVVRARVYKSNYIPGEINTRSFFINRTTDLPILSVVTDPDNLWDDDDGIYTFGVDDYDHFYPYYGANWWRDTKVPAHIELFESSGAELISQNLNLSISGNTSRVYAQKSLNFEAKDALGKNNIPCQIFPQLPIAEFKSFKLRNGGSDWSSTMIRDAVNHTLLEGAMDVDHQSNRPVILYLNGEYWGVMNLTEKIDEDYLNEHFPAIDKDSVDILFSNAEVDKGDANNYNAMIDYIANHSMSQQSNYNYIKTQMDVLEYINYYESRIYYATTDWPNKNIKYWRPKDQSMKWRWAMWDTDRSTLLTTNPNHPCNLNHNTLEWATTSSSVASWAQFLINNLLLNAEFKRQFITQFAHHMNFTFCPNRVDSVLDVFRNRLHDELPAHINRWEDTNDTLDYFTAGFYHSRSEWNTEVDTIKLFFDNRAHYIRRYIMQQFGIGDTSRLSLVKNPPQGGTIQIDSFRVSSNPCDLVYFDGYPVTLTAVPNPGYTFTGWRSNGGSTSPLTWTPHGDTTVTAYFSQVIAQPTVPSSNYSASISNCSDIHLSWTNGNGASRIVVARASSAVNAFPVDFHTYSTDNEFGDGDDLGNGNYVIYSGTGNSCTITGLSTGVTYYFAIFEYNGSSTSRNYNISVYLSGNTTASAFTVVATASANLICEGSPSTLSASGGVDYEWSPASGLSSTTGANVTATPNSTTTYEVLATDINGCESVSEIEIVVNLLPIVTLNNFSDACITSSPITLNGGSPSGGIYSGAFINSGILYPAVVGVGVHPVDYTYTDNNGCTDFASSQIQVNALPVVTLNTFNNVCLDASPFSLSGGNPAGGNYSGTGISGGVFNPSTAGIGTHLITYSYTDNSGCSNSNTSNIHVSDFPVLSLGNDTTICVYNNIVLDAGLGLSSYLWSTNETTQSILVDSTGIGLGTATYLVTGTNADGCSSNDEVSVTFDICSHIGGLPSPYSQIVFPNPFSNEITIITDESDFTATIFDMLGQIVFNKKLNFSNPTLHLIVPDGIYFLLVETSDGTKTIKLLKTNIGN